MIKKFQKDIPSAGVSRGKVTNSHIEVIRIHCVYKLKPEYSLHSGLGPAVLCVLPKLPLGQALSYHIQEGGCIYVNYAEPWNAIKYLHYHGTDGLF